VFNIPVVVALPRARAIYRDPNGLGPKNALPTPLRLISAAEKNPNQMPGNCTLRLIAENVNSGRMEGDLAATNMALSRL